MSTKTKNTKSPETVAAVPSFGPNQSWEGNDMNPQASIKVKPVAAILGSSPSVANLPSVGGGFDVSRIEIFTDVRTALRRKSHFAMTLSHDGGTSIIKWV
jgi:hypothetical protein